MPQIDRSDGPLHAMWGDRTASASIAADLARRPTSQIREALGIPTIADRAVWNDVDPATRAAFAESVRRRSEEQGACLTASVFARYQRDGDRRQYEDAFGARRERLTTAVIMAAVSETDDWLDQAADDAWLLCEQSTWCLPAHDDAHDRRKFVLPDAASPYVDLYAGEVVAQLAVADHVLGERWDAVLPGIRERIRHEAETRVFTPFQARDDFWWLGYSTRTVNNWNPWILGNVLLAATLLIDDVDRLAGIAARVVDSLDRYVATLPADGAIDEGVAYWWNGAARMLECFDLVSRVTDGALDASALPVVAEVLRFPLRMQFGSDWYVNVADGWARSRGHEAWQVPFAWGRRLGDDRVVAWASQGRAAGKSIAPISGGLPRLMRALGDAAWRQATAVPAPLPAMVWLPSVQVLVCRARADTSAGLALAAKGGTNDESHNHKDLGSFIVAVDGRPMLIDVGKPTYTAQTFSDARYGIRAMQSGWHNAPAPHGVEQGLGAEFRTTVLQAPASGREAAEVTGAAGLVLPLELRLDLSSAYPLTAGERWSREFRLVSADRVEIVDCWQLDTGAPSETHLIVAGDVELRGAEVLVHEEDRSIGITTREGIVPTAEVWVLDDPELVAVWGERLTRLTYGLPAAAAGGVLTTVIERRDVHRAVP
ncbi:heparinase II/III domain-containing protein [Gryllotalpicola koreensis]|uniref:Heparinase II/III family protein n=1 Tax=Gryllotalpicola koreensis TaxID=993086 RepID=A0ABP8A533_9MICO